MKPDTYMPLVIGDYLKDTSRLSCEEHGAYLLLLMDYWVNGPLPNNDKNLATICKISALRWRVIRKSIQRYFTVKDGYWRNKRADEELQRANEKSGKARDAANSRWGRSGRIADAYADAMRTDMPGACPASATATASSKVENNPDTAALAADSITALTNDIEKTVSSAHESFGFGLRTMVEMLLSEGHTEAELREAATCAIGRDPKNPNYLRNTVRGRRDDAARTPPRKPRYNPTDASSPDAVRERRTGILAGFGEKLHGNGPASHEEGS